MDQIIIFKEGENLKDKFSNLRLSYQRKYKLVFASRYQHVGHSLSQGEEVLMLYFKEHLDQQDRIRLKNLTLNYPQSRICLCSSADHALDAWKMNVHHFIDYPITSDALIHAYKKYVAQSSDTDSDLIIKNEGEVVKIPLDKITYLRASGNYTFINQKGDISHIQTKQLGHYVNLTENDLNLVRVHRSLIINLKNIKRIGNKQVVFYQCDKNLDISASLQNKLKRIMLGS